MNYEPEIHYVPSLPPGDPLTRNFITSHAITHTVLVFFAASMHWRISEFALTAWIVLIGCDVTMLVAWKRIASFGIDRRIPFNAEKLIAWTTAGLLSHLLCPPVSWMLAFVIFAIVMSTVAACLGLRIASPGTFEKHALQGARLGLGQLFAMITGIAVALGMFRLAMTLESLVSPNSIPSYVGMVVIGILVNAAYSFLSLTALAWCGASWLSNIAIAVVGMALVAFGLFAFEEEGFQGIPFVVSGIALSVHAAAMWPVLASGWRVTFSVPLAESSAGIEFLNDPRPPPSRGEKDIFA